MNQIEALKLIDQSIALYVARNLIDATEVTDLLLDIRLHLLENEQN